MPWMGGDGDGTSANGAVWINDPNNLDEILQKVYGIGYQDYVRLQAQKDTSELKAGPFALMLAGGLYGAGAFGGAAAGGATAAETAAAAGEAGMFAPAAAEGAGGFQTLSGSAAGETVAPQFAGWSSEAAPGAVDWTQPFTSSEGVGAVTTPMMPPAGTSGLTFGEGAAGLSAAAAAASLAGGGGYSGPGNSYGDTLGYGAFDTPATADQMSQAPKGYTLPDGSTVYGTPQQITDAATKGLIPGINSAAALKALLSGTSLGSSLGLGNMLGLTGGAGTAVDALGRALPGLAGAYASSNATDAYERLATQSMNLGAPSRARLEASYQPGFTMASDPGYQDALDATTKATLHGLSVNGNPATSPNAWAQTLSDVNSKFAFPALQNYRNTAISGGNVGLANGMQQQQNMIQSSGNTANSLGAAAANAFNPTPQFNLQDFAKMFGGNQNNIFGTQQ